MKETIKKAQKELLVEMQDNYSLDSKDKFLDWISQKLIDLEDEE